MNKNFHFKIIKTFLLNSYFLWFNTFKLLTWGTLSYKPTYENVDKNTTITFLPTLVSNWIKIWNANVSFEMSTTVNVSKDLNFNKHLIYVTETLLTQRWCWPQLSFLNWNNPSCVMKHQRKYLSEENNMTH